MTNIKDYFIKKKPENKNEGAVEEIKEINDENRQITNETTNDEPLVENVPKNENKPQESFFKKGFTSFLSSTKSVYFLFFF